jgi:hypothetical protein
MLALSARCSPTEYVERASRSATDTLTDAPDNPTEERTGADRP